LAGKTLPSSSTEEGQGGGVHAAIRVIQLLWTPTYGFAPTLKPHHHPALPPSRRKEA
jgi:hypothetical protein